MIIVGLLVLLTAVVIAVTARFGHVSNPGPVPPISESASPSPTTSQRSSLSAVQADLRAALNADSWPVRGGQSLASEVDCYDADATTGDNCVLGTAGKPLIVVYGDSFALNLLPTLDAAVGEDFSIKGLVNLDCPATTLKLTSGGGVNCPVRAQRALSWTQKHQPR